MQTESTNGKLQTAIDSAVGFHGHLGPFLVIGVRMGILAKETFRDSSKDKQSFSLTLRVPMVIPFSCTIDGVQATTRCTIGNQRLKIEDVSEEIAAAIRSAGSERTFLITVNPQAVKELMRRVSEGVRNEELAREVASMPENKLFKFTKRH